jgi:hypothetical protein
VHLPTGYTVAADPSGCAGQAQQRLYGDMPRWFRLNTIVTNLPSEISQEVARDAGLVVHEHAWAACVRARGYRVGDPSGLRERFVRATAHASRAHRRAVEVRMAVTEARCVRRTGLAAAGRELERADTRRVDARNAGAIRERLQLARAALARLD